MDDSTEIMFTTTPQTLYYNASGELYTASGTSGRYVSSVFFNCDEANVVLQLQPRDSSVPNIDEDTTQVRLLGDTPRGEYTWYPACAASVTLTFDLPAAPDEWGWEFFGDQQPTPLKVTVRGKRPTSAS